MVDRSNDVSANEFQQEKNFVTTMVRWLGVPSKDSKVGVLLYGSDGVAAITFNVYKRTSDFNRAVERLLYSPSGKRRVDMALARSASLFTSSHSGERKIAFFLTGGRHVNEAGKREVENAAQWLHNAGVDVFAVGFNNRASMEGLRHVTKTDGSIFRVSDSNQLQRETNLIAPHVISTAG